MSNGKSSEGDASARRVLRDLVPDVRLARPSKWEEASLAQIRIQARHTGAPLTRRLLRDLTERTCVREHHAIDAYTEGLQDRAAGLRCMCKRCELDYQRIQGNERLRVDYASQRRQELRALGVADEQIARQIDAEIASGAALRGSTHEEARS